MGSENGFWGPVVQMERCDMTMLGIAGAGLVVDNGWMIVGTRYMVGTKDRP